MKMRQIFIDYSAAGTAATFRIGAKNEPVKCGNG